MNQRSARAVLGLGVPLLVGLTGYTPLLLAGDELPDRVATHFELGGTPDNSMTVPWAVLTFSLVMAAGVATLLVLTLLRRPLPAFLAPIAAFAGAFIAQMLAGVLAWTVLSQQGLADWTEADGPGIWLVPIIAAALLAGAVAARAATALPLQHSSTTPGDVPVLDLGPGEHAVWTRSLHVPWMLWASLAVILAGLVVASGTKWWLGLPSAVVGLSLMQLSTVRVRVDGDGLAVRIGFLSLFTVRIPIGRMERVAVIDVRPTEWGGWGYRGSLWLMSRAAVVLRAGPGLRVDLADGKVFAVTIDQPAEAAALLNAEIRRSATV